MMMAIFLGNLTLLLGFMVLILPLFVTELSRPRDAIWGAVILLLGLALLNSSDRLNGSPMLMVGLGALLILRLGIEIGQNRWQQLGIEEKQRLGSFERWTTGIQQVGASLAELVGAIGGLIKIFQPKKTSNTIQKKWVRAEENKESQASDQVVSNSNDPSQRLKDIEKKQPQEIFEGHKAPKDS